jgi:hypothetical protein
MGQREKQMRGDGLDDHTVTSQSYHILHTCGTYQLLALRKQSLLRCLRPMDVQLVSAQYCSPIDN